jgi:hypothetical protein
MLFSMYQIHTSMQTINLKHFVLYLRGEQLTITERELVEYHLRTYARARRDILNITFRLQEKGLHILNSPYYQIEAFINQKT